MANYNQFVILGRLAADAQAFTGGSTPVTRLRVASSVGWGDKQKTLWMNATVFGKSAEFASKLKKGDQVLLSGQLEPNEFKDKEGVERKEIVLLAQTVQAVSSKPKDDVPF
jgi:single stranded DNA-binding protein